MNTLKHYLGALRLVIMGAFGFLNYASPSMGAKTGVITAPTGADENLKTLGASQPVRDTLMGVIRQALQLAVAVKTAVINFGVRKAVIVPAATNVDAAQGTLLGVLTKDDPNKASSPWTFVGEAALAPFEAQVEAITAAAKPAMSVESLVNKLEELGEAEVGNTLTTQKLIVTINQNTGEVTLSAADDDADAAAKHVLAVALAEDVQFVQTLDAGGTQFGE